MALIKCPECGKEVDSTFKSCPNCGFPFELSKENDGNTTTQSASNKQTDGGVNGITNNLSYTKKSLLEGEHIIGVAKWHPIIKFWAVFLLLFSLTIFFLWLKLSFEGYLFVSILAWSFPLFIVSLIGGVVFILSIKYREFVVTNKRIIVKSGIIIRQAFELRIRMLESISVYQGILGRLLGYGAIRICGTGASHCWVFYVANPLEFRQHVFTELQFNK